MTLTVKSLADIPKHIEPGTQFIIDVFPGPDKADQTITEEMLALESEIYNAIDKKMNDKVLDSVEVRFDKGYVHIGSMSRLVAEIGGDVIDRKITVEAGKVKKYKLTGEGNGYVTVNDEQFSYDG